MKKRVLAGILMMVFVLASVMTVSAADSKKADIRVTESQKGHYVVTEGAEEFAEIKTAKQALYDAIVAFNAKIDATTEAKLFEGTQILDSLKGKVCVTDVFDLDKINNGLPLQNGKHQVTIEIDALTDGMTGIVVVHYDMQRGWEVITPDNVEGKKITATYDNLSPVIIYANAPAGGGTGSSPSTAGTSSAWMLMAAVAIIALGTVVVVSQKKAR